MYFLLRPAKTEENKTNAQVALLSSFLTIGKPKWYEKYLLREPKSLSFEIASIHQKTAFYLTTKNDLASYFSSQITSQYPKTLVETLKEDPLREVMRGRQVAVGYLHCAYGSQYMLQTRKNVEGQLASILGFLSKLTDNEAAFIQYLIRSPEKQEKAQQQIRSYPNPEEPLKSQIAEKLLSPLLEMHIRVIFAGQDTVKDRLSELMGTYGVYTRSEGNALVPHTVEGYGKKRAIHHIARREFLLLEPLMTVNLEEAASLWYLPDASLNGIKNLWWGKTYSSEPPDNLPVAEKTSPFAEATEGLRSKINYFATTEWKNREEVFGIKKEDRGKHMYIIGKTGTGKSTLIGNMAINDIRNGDGVAVIDPHGDLCEIILNYIPKRRVNDVVYLDPTLSDDRMFSLNLFDQGSEHTDVVASGIVSVFYKLYHNSWGPRLEYILRNSVLSLLLYGEATFADIPLLLTNPKFREKVVAALAKKDKVLTHFWIDEFDNLTDKLRVEATSPILNKVGQFLASQRIRHIVGSKKSTFSFEDIMDNKKILLVNLSQGKLGEDTTALLGAMFITKMQLTAMKRVAVAENKRTDFYLYVDEFQNFATTSFVKILSEARKYKLNLTLANQYIGQVDEEIQKAIFGNVGTLVTFLVGSRDATIFEKEFGGKFSADDLVGLGKHEVILKMAIDGLTSDPFLARTLPPPSVVNGQREKILARALESYYRKL